MVSVDGKKKKDSSFTGKRRCQHAAIDMGDKVSAVSKKYCPGARRFFLDISVSMCILIVIAIVLLIVVIALDSKGYLHVTLKDAAGKDTGKRISEAAYENLDPAVIEKQIGMKVLSIDQYERMEKEIKDYKAQLSKKEAELRQKESKIIDITKKLDTYEKSSVAPGTISTSTSSIDNFCVSCVWNSGVTCEGRAKFIMDGQGKGEVETKLWMMTEYPQCKNK